MDCTTCGSSMDFIEDDLFQCVKCGLISSSFGPDLSLYDKSYYTKYVRYQRSERGRKINEFRGSLVEEISNKAPILDFGCGSGAFLEECAFREIPAVGFDINPYSPFCDITNLFNGHEVVTFWDSLEHLSEPRKVILGLRPKYLFVCAPSVDDFGGKSLTQWHHYYPGEHLHYFNLHSLSVLFEMCGYCVVEYSYRESEFRTSGGTRNILTLVGKFTG